MNKKTNKNTKYIRIAQETKMLYDAFLTAGFTTEEAFELTKQHIQNEWEFEC